jgi:hypothetical protein
MKNIQQEIESLRMQRYFKDMTNIYNKLVNIVDDELGTSVEQFLLDYYELKKELMKCS